MTLRVLIDIFSDIQNSFSYKGEWDIKNIYNIGDFVLYNNNLYSSKENVDHSGDISSLLYHDDFHRANTLDGWGTSTEGITWNTEFESDGPGSVLISSNEGVATSSGTFSENISSYPIPSLSTRNIEVLWKFYITDTTYYYISLFFLSGLLESRPAAFIELQSNGTDSAMEISVASPSIVVNKTGISPVPGLPLSLNTDYFIRLHSYGNFYSARLWKATDTEPSTWTISTLSDVDLNPSTAILIDAYSLFGAGSIHIKDVKVYGLPDVSPDVMTSEWMLVNQ